MSKLILTSDGIDSKEIFDYFKSNILAKSKVAVITTAKPKEKLDRGESLKSKFQNLKTKVDLIDLEFDSPKVLLNYDLIFLDGGSPFRLMHWIRESKSIDVFKKLFKENKIIAGRSAGSMVLGTNFSICEYLSPEMNIEKITDFSGLGFCDINICPHYNNFPNLYKDCEKKVKKCKKEQKINILKLYDGQALVIENNVVTLIDGKVQPEDVMKSMS